MASFESSSGLLQFTLPEFLNDYENFWGPIYTPNAISTILKQMASYPFNIAAKSDRIGRVCDFTYLASQKYQARDGRAGAFAHEKDTEFQLVDSRPLKSNRYQGRARMINRRQNIQPQQEKQLPIQKKSRNQQLNQRLYNQYQQRQQQWRRTNRLRQLAEWSIEPQQNWDFIETIQLAILPKMDLDASKVTYTDIEFCGELRMYDKSFDRASPKQPPLLSDKYSKECSFYWPSTTDDTILLSKFEEDESLTVAVTDQILACLMAAAQSRLSWHLIFHKSQGRLVIDKQNGTSIDIMTVGETSKDPPLADHPIKINRLADLGAEALKINQNFGQQVLQSKTVFCKDFGPPPFVESKDVPASKVYRYRVITLPPSNSSWQPESTEFAQKSIKLLVRTEIDAVLPQSEDQYVMIRALNEYNPAFKQSWTQQLETHHGALIAQESKNNQCKVTKWVSQALIGGSDYIRIGFVTRSAANDNKKHQILNVQAYKVKELSTQIGMQLDNIWGIVRSFIDLVMAQKDGNYILVKDPVKHELKLYRVDDDEADVQKGTEVENVDKDIDTVEVAA